MGLEKIQQVKLPFPMQDVVGDIGDLSPFVFRSDAAGAEQYVQMRVVVAGASSGLQYDDKSDVKVKAECRFENILHAFLCKRHERGQEAAVPVEIQPKKSGTVKTTCRYTTPGINRLPINSIHLSAYGTEHERQKHDLQVIGTVWEHPQKRQRYFA